MAEVLPGVTREEAHEIGFDFYGVFIAREVKPAGQPSNMGIDNHACIDVERITQNDICGFASYTRQGSEGVEFTGDFASMQSEKLSGAGADIFCFVAEKARGADNFFEFFLRNGCVIRRGFAAFK